MNADELTALVEKALNKAFDLGQTYWQQADSESYKQNKLSYATRDKFVTLKDELRSALVKLAPEGEGGDL